MLFTLEAARKMMINAASLRSVTVTLKMFVCYINPESNSVSAKNMNINFLSWRLWASAMKKIGGMLSDLNPNSDCWKNVCSECIDGKK